MKLILALWFFLLIGLSYLSGYSITQSVADVNFDIATMLAPSGLIHNFLIDPNHYLRPYYTQGTLTQSFFLHKPEILGVYIVFAVTALLGLLKLRKKSE